MSTSVLFVCTGNVCRSPMAELLLRAKARSDVIVASSGLGALVGEPMDGSSAAALAELGVDPSRHRARQFDLGDALARDLVLTAERWHRDRIIADAPQLYRRTFTMREFARLVQPGSGPDAPAIVAAAAARRGRVEVGEPASDDIADPYRGTLAAARTTAAAVQDAVQAVIAGLGVRRRPRPYPTD